MTKPQNEPTEPAEHNQPAADGEVTQKNEPRRTPESRNDRESHIGSGNQSQSRRGATGGSH